MLRTVLNYFSLSDMASFTGQMDITMETDRCVLWTKGLTIFC